MAKSTTEYEFHSPDTLRWVGNELPEAAERDIFWMDPSAEGPELERIETNKAIFNPETGQLFGVVTDEYEVINPREFVGPLVDELEERGRYDGHGGFTV